MIAAAIVILSLFAGHLFGGVGEVAERGGRVRRAALFYGLSVVAYLTSIILGFVVLFEEVGLWGILFLSGGR